MSPSVVTLTTDFGLADGFVGAMKGVALGIFPEITLIDITHDVPPQDIRAGGLILGAACPYFPDGTIHVAVVDPGVGSDRRAILVQDAKDNLFLGPDNGLLTFALDREGARVRELANRGWFLEGPSATFHGRDIFAPAAARLASGAAPADAGPGVADAVRLPFPVPLIEVEEEENRTRIHGVIVHIDRFGNLITNVDRALFDKAWAAGRGVGARVILKNRAVAGWVRYYGEAGAAREDAEEKSGALFNSWGLLEVFVPSGNAAELLDARVDEHVTIEINA